MDRGDVTCPLAKWLRWYVRAPERGETGLATTLIYVCNNCMTNVLAKTKQVAVLPRTSSARTSACGRAFAA
jgi:hypothetical protein